MKYKKEALDLLLELVREELWQLPMAHEKEPVATLPEVMKLAEEQCVQGFAINSLFRRNADIGKGNVLRCISYRQQIEKNNQKLDAALERLAAVLNRYGIKYVVFKGQTVAAYYPNPHLRIPGDIDFYCEDCDYSRAQKAIAKELGVVFEPRDLVDRHDSFGLNGVRFEMHYKMEVLGASRHQRRYDRMMSDAVASPLLLNFEHTDVATLPPTYNVLHIFKHLFNHLLVEGVGMRQFCDLAVIIGKNADSIDADFLKKCLKDIGYWKAFLATGAFLVKYLGLPIEKFPYQLSAADYKWSDRILCAILLHGNFGRYNRKTTNSKIAKSIETAKIAFGHCFKFFPLAPSDIIYLIPRRISITLKHYI